MKNYINIFWSFIVIKMTCCLVCYCAGTLTNNLDTIGLLPSKLKKVSNTGGTDIYLINLWLPSRCHREFGPATLYNLLCGLCDMTRSAAALGLIRTKLLRTLCICARIPAARNCALTPSIPDGLFQPQCLWSMHRGQHRLLQNMPESDSNWTSWNKYVNISIIAYQSNVEQFTLNALFMHDNKNIKPNLLHAAFDCSQRNLQNLCYWRKTQTTWLQEMKLLSSDAVMGEARSPAQVSGAW